MRLIPHERIGEYLKTVVDILAENNFELPSRDVVKEMSKRLTFNETEMKVLNDAGDLRWVTVLRFKSLGLVKGEYILKQDNKWMLTEKGKTLIGLTSEEIYNINSESYKEWAKNREDSDEENDGETEPKSINEITNIDYLIELSQNDEFGKYDPHSLADPERIKIRDIITHAKTKEWMLPRFQRYFDWDRNDIRELWEAIFKDYYIGSFLLWDVNKSPEVGIQPIAGVPDVNDRNSSPDYLILDGQQRVTSLFYAVSSPTIPSSVLKVKNSSSPLYYYINFYSYYTQKDVQVVEVYTTKFPLQIQLEKMLFPIFELGNHRQWIDQLEDHLIEKTNDREFSKKIRRDIDKRLDHIWQNYEIPFVALPHTMGLNQVTDIFEGINTKGKLLNVFDLLIARLYKYDKDLRSNWDETQEAYPLIKDYFKTISKMPIYILQTMSLLYEKNSSASRKDLLNVYGNIYENSQRDFEEDWEDISNYMNTALNKLENLKDGFGVRSVKELPFAPMIPVLTALLKTIDEQPNKAECYEKLKQWYWSAVFTNAYGAGADSQMSLDFREMRNYFKDSTALPRVIVQMHREINNLYLKEIKSQSNAQYRGTMSLIALQDARDFDTGLSLENARKNDKDHIFPKYMTDSVGNKYINSVLNMTWMSDSTNRKIKNAKKPSLYTKEFLSEKYSNDTNKFLDILDTHLIDKRAYGAMQEDNFESFLTAREKKIIEKLTEFVGNSSESESHSLILPNTPFSNKMSFLKTLKECDSYIYWLDKYFSVNGLSYLNEVLHDKPFEELKIILSVENVNEFFRDRFKDFCKEFPNTKISMRIITDKHIKSNLHDRFIVSKFNAFNIPSIDVIGRGQLSEISESTNDASLRNEFEATWETSLDLINEWEKIRDFKKDNIV